MSQRDSTLTAGAIPAYLKTRVSEFRSARAPTGPGEAATSRGLSFLRRLSAHALSRATRLAQYPSAVHKTAATAWRKLAGFFRASNFYSEAEAQRRTLSGPKLPHHRHPMTLHEAIAGAILALLVLTAAITGIVEWLA